MESLDSTTVRSATLWAVIDRPYSGKTGLRYLACLTLIALLSACSKPPDLPALGAVPDFSFNNQESRQVTRAELGGKVWIADFIFTNCSGICPNMTGQMRRLQEKLPSEIRLVSFSVDPKHDTPEVLAEYATKSGADTKRWSFLTGDKEALYKLSKTGFKLAVDDTDGTPTEPVSHSSRFVLVDREGKIRGYYGMEDPGAMDRLAVDAKRLL